MSIAIYDVNGAHGDNAGADKNLTLTPTAVGHLMVIVANKADNTVPTGWDAACNSTTVNARIYTKVSAASGAQTATLPALGAYALVSFCVSGSTNVAVDTSTQRASSGTTLAAPTVDAKINGIIINSWANSSSSNVIALPSGHTNIYNVASGAGNRYFRATYKPIDTTGATGTVSTTQDTSAAWGAAMMALDAMNMGGLFFGVNF